MTASSTSPDPILKPARGEIGATNTAHRRLIAAATEVFGRLGFSKTTVQDIVSAAQVSRPLF
jgi:AcrR family transcriptional regulator